MRICPSVVVVALSVAYNLLNVVLLLKRNVAKPITGGAGLKGFSGTAYAPP
jgi:hypothetical protein